ncbi:MULTISPECIES: 4-alpha-glucanotransferase [Anaerotruncus]|uniref:4-alpha-glucanotransferase n=1 Tax=Anaerotruncus TaxID=244127 RepID=UPI0023F3306D|nr:4-alpha-glucanotransferase [Anaerotruncus massiliensis (ex Togo et al. 2019)]
MRRGAGVLLPVTSLPSPYGIGTFGRAAYAFVDFLRDAGQRYWQVLPLGPTSYGDSPYQSFSAFAGNPYFIDLDLLEREGLLTGAEISACGWGDDPAAVDYARIYRHRFTVLHAAFRRSRHADTPAYREFCAENAVWLEDYSLYMAVKMHFGGHEWLRWPEDIRMREPEALARCARELAEEIDFWKFCQFKFFEQWRALKSYANGLGVEIIGDIPIYVALDSADVWAHPEQFQLDGQRRPSRVAGVPPDMFSSDGQLWGNPLYDWERMAREDYAWWKLRMKFSSELYDVVRIDHFVGIAHYYSIPAGDDTAKNGVWVDGPGEGLIAAISSVMGGKRVIAEDLGIVIPEVGRMLKRSGYPGMKLMQFGFDSGPDNEYLPCHYDKNVVVYGGTHDNETLAGFFAHQPRGVLRFARAYLGVRTSREIPWALIRAGYASSADTAVFQMQDLLGLGNEARMNTPSTIGENWRWRLAEGQLTSGTARKLRELAELYGR